MNKQEKALELLKALKEREIGVAMFSIGMRDIFGKESKQYKELERLNSRLVEVNEYYRISEEIIKGH